MIIGVNNTHASVLKTKELEFIHNVLENSFISCRLKEDVSTAVLYKSLHLVELSNI